MSVSINSKVIDDTTGVTDASRGVAGFGQDTTISTASALPGLATAIAAGATVAIIQATVAALYWRDDGTSPAGTVGMSLAAGDSFLYVGDLSAIEVISATGTVNVSYYK